MKTIRTLSVLAASVLFAGAVHGETILQSYEDAGYTPTFFYAGNAWTTNATASGFEISGSADNAGEDGFANNIGAFNITASGETDLALTLQLGATNTAAVVQVLLRNQGTGDVNRYQFDLSDFNTSTFTTITMSLATPFQVDGAGVDLSSLDRLQIQGTGGNASGTIFDFTVGEVSVIPEPSAYSLLFGSVALAMIALRRRFNKK